MRASCSQLLVDKLNVSVLRHFLNEMSLVEGGIEIIWHIGVPSTTTADFNVLNSQTRALQRDKSWVKLQCIQLGNLVLSSRSETVSGRNSRRSRQAARAARFFPDGNLCPQGSSAWPHKLLQTMSSFNWAENKLSLVLVLWESNDDWKDLGCSYHPLPPPELFQLISKINFCITT